MLLIKLRTTARKVRDLAHFMFLVANLRFKIIYINKFSKKNTVIFGPYLGEVGFEVLYWAPFVNYMKRLITKKVIVISRGGILDLYDLDDDDLYIDFFTKYSPNDLVNLQNERIKVCGNQKQNFFSDSEKMVLDSFFQPLNDFYLIHPGVMFKLFSIYYLRTLKISRILPYLKYKKFNKKQKSSAIAIKVYKHNDLNSDNDLITLTSILGGLSKKKFEIISLESSHTYDEHQDLKFTFNLSKPLNDTKPQDNLAAQVTILLKTKILICANGGIAYLGIMCGNRVYAMNINQRKVNTKHTDLARYLASEVDTVYDVCTVNEIGDKIKV